MIIDPAAFSFVQGNLLHHLNDAFDLIAHYALNLLYIFTVFEVVITGFAWAMQPGAAWDRVFFKIIKIGIIFFIIQNYMMILDVIVRSFADLGGVMANTPHLDQFIFNPAKIWQLGYDNGLLLLRSAALSGSVGLALINVILGMGILFAFGLLGIQIVVSVTGFYMIGLVALIFIPLGVFNPTINFFEQAVRSVLQAGARLMVLILVIGIAVTLWKSFGLLKWPTDYTINQPLGLFFSALLFLYLGNYLSKWVADIIGKISLQRSEGGVIPSVTVEPAAVGVSVAAAELNLVQTATNVTPALSIQRGFEPVQTAAVASTTISGPQGVVTQVAPVATAPSSLRASNLGRANLIEKSISDTVIKKMKKTFLDVLEEKALKDTLK